MFASVVQGLPELSDADGNAVILIGGQAISFWGRYYDIAEPLTDSPALTQDLDFKGGKTQARSLANSIGASIKLAGFDDATPNTALLIWEPSRTAKTAPRRLMIDFLSGALGVPDKEINKLAVPVQIEDLPVIRVMHPLHCMQSRFANLAIISSKRDTNGIAQARMGVEIARRYVEKDAAMQSQSFVARAMSKIMEICTAPPAIFAFSEFGIDGIEAIDLSLLPLDHLFVLVEYPKLLKKLARKREIDAARRSGEIHLPNTQRSVFNKS